MTSNIESRGMTIRYTCVECASVLKIKDELSGTPGRCPKCKTKFVVPVPEDEFAGIEIEIESDYAPGQIAPQQSSMNGGQETQQTELLPVAKSHSPNFAPLQERTKDEGPLSNTPHSSSPLTAINSGQSEFLSLDDSNTEIDALPPHFGEDVDLDASGNGTSVVPIGAIDEELDSPPMMVSPLLKSLGYGHRQPESAGKAQSSPEKSATSAKKSGKSQSNAPFDPLQFLMSDRPPVDLSPPPPEPNQRRPGSSATIPIQTSPMPAKRSSTSERRFLAPDMIDDDDEDLSLSDDSNDDFQARITPLPLSRPTPQPATSRLTPEKVDLDTAAKMMKKAIKESQAATARQREREANAGFDYGLFFREFGWRGAALLAAIIVGIPLLYYGFNSMLSKAQKLPKLGYVSGTIKLNGQPFQGAEINIAPMETELPGSKRERIRTSVGQADQQGNFTMMYLPNEKIKGVAAGKCRIWVTHMGEHASEIPGEYLEGATHIIEITEGNQKEPLNLDLKSPPKRKK